MIDDKPKSGCGLIVAGMLLIAVLLLASCTGDPTPTVQAIPVEVHTPRGNTIRPGAGGGIEWEMGR